METQVKVIHVHICIHHAFLIYIHVHVHRLLICVSTVQYLRVGRLWKDGAVSVNKYNGSELHFGHKAISVSFYVVGLDRTCLKIQGFVGTGVS